MLVSDISFFPSARSGRGLPPAHAAEAWATAAWLLAVEGRAYMEDLEGAAGQPELRQAVRLRLLELLADIDGRLCGAEPGDEAHGLALALEYGLREVAVLGGTELDEVFGLDTELGDGAEQDIAGLARFWDALCAAFPGTLPDPLKPSGQKEILRALRNWSRLCAAAGTDAAFLEPFLKDA